MKSWLAKSVLGGLAMAQALSGCAVGPDFEPPAPPPTDAYAGGLLAAQTEPADAAGGEAQRFQLGRDLPGEWWTLFGSTRLDALIAKALANYPDIAVQQAALRAAREMMAAEQGVFLPQFQGAGNATREKIGGATPAVPGFITDVYQASISVAYTFDIFGGERRTLEGLQAEADAQNFQLEASYLTLTSNVASTAIQVASLREQIAATREIIAIEEKQLAVIERQLALGSRTNADLLQQQSTLASVRATLPTLYQQLAMARHQLAVLTGDFPRDTDAFVFDLSDLKLPQDLPVSLPSALVAQRPDIRAQELLIRKANADIGVATANMLPQLTLSGSYGAESLSFSTLFAPQSAVWNFAGGIAQPLFEGGTLRAKRRAAIDAYDQAGAQYRLTVLQAFQNVADTLTALAYDAQALKAEDDAVKAAKASLDLIQRQYAAGAVNYVSLLTAQQTYQQARIADVRAAAQRYTDTVALFQALGGGWWNRHDPGTAPRTSSS
jgi:NodT family efflux transporter outer membrane factor (OMF) lipoprotein